MSLAVEKHIMQNLTLIMMYIYSAYENSKAEKGTERTKKANVCQMTTLYLCGNCQPE